jgi:hypothetical protein
MNRVVAQPLGYATAFAGYLDPGEKVLWAGQPRQGVYLRSNDWIAIPFSMLWGGFAIFWEVMALSSSHSKGPAPIIFPIFGIPFVVIGLYMMVGRFFVDAWQRRRTWYGITDRRALIVRVGGAGGLKSYDLRTVGEVDYQMHSDGTGSLVFGPTIYTSRNRSMNFQASQGNRFDHISDAAEAYRVVRQVQQGGAGIR